MAIPTTANDITATVTGIAAAELAVPPQSLAPDTDLRAIEGIDSVKVLRMIARVERAYDVELSDEDVFSLTTVEGTVSAVRAALAQQGIGERS
jgi:acyl carrier protein